MASEHRAKVQNLKRRRMEEIQRDIADMVHARHDDVLRMPRGNSKKSNSKLNLSLKFVDFEEDCLCFSIVEFWLSIL